MVELWFAHRLRDARGYVVLDGFDFGRRRAAPVRGEDRSGAPAGARGDRTVLGRQRSVAARDRRRALFVAFPRVLASGLSGFYFAIFLVLWTLILRGISIEFRSHVEDPLWRSAWDAVVLPSPARCCRSCSAPRSATSCADCRSTPTAGSRSPLFTDFTPRAAGRHSRLVHGAARASSRSWPSPGTARRSWRGRPTGRCTSAAAAPPPGCTPRSRCSGRC